MTDGKIQLEKMINTRDLGGLLTADGCAVKKHCLIRSGALFGASENDLCILKEKYGVKTVVDLRTPVEAENEPDPPASWFDYYDLSLLDDSFFGIARDEYSVLSWLNLFADKSVDPDAVFCEMYRKLLFGDNVKPLFKRFFQILLSASDAVLWHCTAGKDRAGIVTALVLCLLGVPRKTIIDDYMMTGVYTADDIAAAKRNAEMLTKDRHILKAVDVLMNVKEEYLSRLFDEAEKEYGGLKEYLVSQSIISENDVEALKEKYTE